jgi:hypothetical protein
MLFFQFLRRKHSIEMTDLVKHETMLTPGDYESAISLHATSHLIGKDCSFLDEKSTVSPFLNNRETFKYHLLKFITQEMLLN